VTTQGAAWLWSGRAAQLPAHRPWGAGVEVGGEEQLHWLSTAFQGEDWDCRFVMLVLMGTIQKSL